jgi:hypothetical protein
LSLLVLWYFDEIDLLIVKKGWVDTEKYILLKKRKPPLPDERAKGAY